MKKIALFLVSLCLVACSWRSTTNHYTSIKSTGDVYKTEYLIYWCPGYTAENETIYTNDSVYVCSFQGTNFLLEKNNSEELFSTTAPIRILSVEKIK
jgi:hypothetical protein